MKFAESMNGVVNFSESLTFRGTQMESEFHPFNARSARISLKQWKMFQAVVDFDGFTGAASHLHISQSAISYTLAKLQEQLGVALLKIEGRKAQITEEGKILLDRSRDLVRNAMELEVLAENLRHGWGPEIRLVVDPSFPPQLLMLALRQLSPHLLNIRLSVEAMTQYQANIALHEHTADLAITTQVPLGFEGNELIEIEHIAVAHPEHPLFCLKRLITLADLAKQVQIVISGSGDRVSTNSNQLLSGKSRRWNVNGFDIAIDALGHGLGYAWLPKYRVQRWLDENKISILPLNNGASYKSNLYIIFGSSVGAKSGAKRFADVLCKLAENGPFPIDPKTS